MSFTESIEEIRKKIEKKFFVRKNQKFYQLHDAIFDFLKRCLVHILLIKLGIFFDQMVALCEK